MKPAVSLCVVNYNGAKHLKRTLGALAAQSWVFDEVILIDNASTDASVRLARELLPGIVVVELDRNLGPGAARNAALVKANNDLILFLDNDVILQDDTAERLVTHLQTQSEALLVAPRVEYDAQPGIIQYDSADCHFLGLMATRNANMPADKAPLDAVETNSLVTACFVIDRRRLRNDVLFDETLGFNLEDHDFGLRCRLSGHHLWALPSARVRHSSGTPGLSYRPGGQSSDQRLFYLTRNRWLIVGKCFSVRTLFRLAPALFVFELAQLVWLLASGRIGIWVRAMRSTFARRTELCDQRRMVQSSRLVSDAEVLSDLPLPLTDQSRGSRLSKALLSVTDRTLRGYFRLVRL